MRSMGNTKILDVRLLEHHDDNKGNCLISESDGIEDVIDSDSLASSLDGLSFAVGSKLGKVTIWSRSPSTEHGSAFMSTQLDLNLPPGRRRNPGLVLALSPDGVHLAVSCRRAAMLELWQRNPGSGTMSMVRAYSYVGDQPMNSYGSLFMSFSSCGRFLAMTTKGRVFGVLNDVFSGPAHTIGWDFATLLDGSAVPNFRRVSRRVSSQIMSFGPNGAHLAIFEGSSSATLSLVHSASGDLIWELSIGGTSGVRRVLSIVFNSVGTRIATLCSFIEGPRGTTLSLVDTINGVLLWEVPLAYDSFQVPMTAFGRNDQVIMIQMSKLCIHDAFTGSEIGSQAGFMPCNVAFEHDDGIWITKRGRKILYLPSHCQHQLRVMDWTFHPHRYLGYDVDRQAPFVIEFSCDGCTAKASWRKKSLAFSGEMGREQDEDQSSLTSRMQQLAGTES